MADFSTPRKSSGISKGTTSSLAGEVGQVRETLLLNGLHMDDHDAAETFKQYINEARDLLTNPRHSAASKQLLQGINKVAIDYAHRNETTFTNKFFGVFQGQSRHVKQAAQGSRNQECHDEQGEDPEKTDQMDLPVPVGWAARDWADDGLDASYNRVFQAGSVPKLDSMDGNYKAILDKLPKISKPQPDILYGTSIKNHYTYEERAVIAQHKDITQISLDLACPFLVGEIKTHGDFEEAANQANPGGAAMVEAHRKLKFLAQRATSKAKINDTAEASKSATAHPPKDTTTLSVAKTTATPNVPTIDTTSKAPKANSKASKADFSTKAYSLVLQPKYAQINVHWVEEGKGKGKGEDSITYHMHEVESYALNKEEQLKACRAAVNNILDWGLGERDTEIKALLNQVYNSSKALNGATAKGKGKDKAVDESPASKKRRVDDVDDGNVVAWQAIQLSNPEN